MLPIADISYEQKWKAGMLARLAPLILFVLLSLIFLAVLLSTYRLRGMMHKNYLPYFLAIFALLIAMLRIGVMVPQPLLNMGRDWKLAAGGNGIEIDSGEKLEIGWEEIKEIRKVGFSPKWTEGTFARWEFDLRHWKAGPTVTPISWDEKKEFVWYGLKLYKWGEKTHELAKLIFPGFFHIKIEKGREKEFERAVLINAGKKIMGKEITTDGGYEEWVC